MDYHSDINAKDMEEHEQTYLSLDVEQRKQLEKISIKYGKVMSDLMYELSKLVTHGVFRGHTMFGYMDIHIRE